MRGKETRLGKVLYIEVNEDFSKLAPLAKRCTDDLDPVPGVYLRPAWHANETPRVPDISSTITESRLKEICGWNKEVPI